MSVAAEKTCLIIGASHGGVTAAFQLRKEGWLGKIVLIDADPVFPYHRPPLSKTHLTESDASGPAVLKAQAAYEKDKIELQLGKKVTQLDTSQHQVQLETGEALNYDKLILATGASAFIPPIQGLSEVSNAYTLRTANDVEQIKTAFNQSSAKRVVIIGGGYIGLETAASFKKLGAEVTVIERESRLLARVTSPEMSAFFEELHAENGVQIQTNQSVTAISENEHGISVSCLHADQSMSQYEADIIVVGVGVSVNQALAEQAGIEVNQSVVKGIVIDEHCRTSHPDVYAIGDCTYHHNPYYDRWLRLESVQNAVDQAKTASSNIRGKTNNYDALPWFWSDQFNIKLQMVGLATGYNELVIRKELTDEHKFSVWYFKDDTLLAVDAVNHAKAYVLGTKLLKARNTINRHVLADSASELSASALVG